MTPDEHRARHVELHRALDELFADFVVHQPGSRFLERPIFELMNWSHMQTIEPSPLDEARVAH